MAGLACASCHKTSGNYRDYTCHDCHKGHAGDRNGRCVDCHPNGFPDRAPAPVGPGGSCDRPDPEPPHPGDGPPSGSPGGLPAFAADPPPRTDPAGLKLKGTLYARYSYVGSSFPGTIYSGLVLTGQLQLSAFSDKIVLKYRSHHWLDFAKPAGNVLESPFENRHIFQTVSLETNGLLAPGLKLKLGRFFPDLDYASTPVIDGGGVSYAFDDFTLSAAAGRMVDLWSGTTASADLMTAAQIKYRTAKFSVSAGFQNAAYFGVRRPRSRSDSTSSLAKPSGSKPTADTISMPGGYRPGRIQPSLAEGRAQLRGDGLALEEPLRPAVPPRQGKEPGLLGAVFARACLRRIRISGSPVRSAGTAGAFADRSVSWPAFGRAGWRTPP